MAVTYSKGTLASMRARGRPDPRPDGPKLELVAVGGADRGPDRFVVPVLENSDQRLLTRAPKARRGNGSRPEQSDRHGSPEA